MNSLASIDPSTGQTVQKYTGMSRSDWESILERTQAAHDLWRQAEWSVRARLMHKAGDLLDSRQEDYARLMAREMGKPIAQGRAEANKCASTCHFYADKAESFLKPESIETEAQKSYVTFQPLGVVLAVMPWNFPFWQVIRFAAPALMAGNGGVLKHASNVTGCALALEQLFRDAGFPTDIFRALVMSSKEMSAVIAHPIVQAVTLTGSTGAGKAVAAKAGEMLKKSVMELGGSDPYLILEDADLDLAAASGVSSRLINAGQSCIAAKRFIVVEKVKKRFEELFVKEMKKHKVGNPLDETCDVGPMARTDLRDELHKIVQATLDKGAKLLLGGTIPSGPGAYYPPTVLTDVTKEMPAFYEETFGPVAAIIGAKDEEEAIALANGTEFGLGAAVFTKDIARGERIAVEKIQAGSCFVNAFVRSDPRLPFGGIKGSGYGRELSSYGIKEFVNIKTIYIGKNDSASHPHTKSTSE